MLKRIAMAMAIAAALALLVPAVSPEVPWSEDLSAACGPGYVEYEVEVCDRHWWCAWLCTTCWTETRCGAAGGPGYVPNGEADFPDPGYGIDYCLEGTDGCPA